MNTEIFKKVGNATLRLVFGPVTEGVVIDVKYDENAPVIHILVETKARKLKHFIHQDGAIVSLSERGLKIQAPNYLPGDYYWIRTRGTGMLLFPGSPIEKDPFNLKPKTPLADSIKRV